MALDIEFLVSLAEILNKAYFDNDLYDKFIRTRGAKAFLKHEKVDKLDMKKELIKIIEEEAYEDKFQFYQIKEKIPQLLEDIEYIKKYQGLIIDKALERVYKIVPEEMEIHRDIYLYAGGVDGGFTLNRSRVFINYSKYIGKEEDFIKILSHELYHSRIIPLRYKLKFTLRTIPKNKRYAYNILGKLLEEGIASLIQHGAILNKDHLMGKLTGRNLAHIREQFNILNSILIDARYGNFDKTKLKNLNVYSTGYLIVTTVYKQAGVLPLDSWTMNLDFRGIIRTYNELCIKKNLPYRFNYEAIEWLI